VDKVHGRTFMIGYDSNHTLVFNFINSTEACDDDKKRDKASSANEQWRDQNLDKDSEAGFDWQHAHWTSLPYPGGEAHEGRWFDTEHCFLSSDHLFMVPAYDHEGGEAGFSMWDHETRIWSHVRIDRPCSCHEQEIEDATGKVKVKKDEKKLRFEYPNRFALVYQSFRGERREGGGHDKEEALDTIVIQWKDQNQRDHLTGIQLVNHQINSCHDIKIG